MNEEVKSRPNGRNGSERKIYARHDLAEVADQLEDAAGGRRGVPAALLHGRAEHVAAVAARDEVALAGADRALDEVLALRVAQAHDLALDGADGDGARGQARAPARARRRRRRTARGDRRRRAASTPVDAVAVGAQAAHAPGGSRRRRSTASASAATRRRGSTEWSPGDVEREPDGRRERGLRAAGLARAQALDPRPSLRRKASRRSSSSASSRSRATTSVPDAAR